MKSFVGAQEKMALNIFAATMMPTIEGVEWGWAEEPLSLRCPFQFLRKQWESLPA